ncbi:MULTISPECIES: SRPBCC family protein [unclassified Rhodococcus (in: high G+C Gram-positive bacteria)]|jgi:uncharacterized membrane protein|uniref:SRPBCC family protein n=1 Tax=unclassified Rhodococcus (in: high G+C Gram-positive bacteria) TaxID=192944 RepID=UPI00146D79AE|nr:MULTISPECIES: SRPBCC family protein [unclassified Rhodococcus (in: high G+C Gram-positive bacteria)]MBF0660168.1 SRPBCC family protein [Rhodococcus sp. (in: high G+C Gram-positive bacteria)]NMD97538.1 SRPBCC family protein [Rhodococcus sp. BL-253-APC-6A1W]
MIHLRHSATAEIPADVAFAYVDDHRTVPEWMFGMTRFQPVGTQVSGLGTVYDATMRVGPKTLDSRVEVVEWEFGRSLALESVAGMRSASTWRFIEIGDERTRLDVDFAYQLPGGLAGMALGKLIEPIVGTAVRHTEQALRSQLRDLA